jgi:plasmid stability protein
MKNVTISLPSEVYRRARIKAAERDSSVSAMVRDFLTSLGEEDSEFARRKKLQADVLGSIRNFRAGNRLTRDAVHARRGSR